MAELTSVEFVIFGPRIKVASERKVYFKSMITAFGSQFKEMKMRYSAPSIYHAAFSTQKLIAGVHFHEDFPRIRITTSKRPTDATEDLDRVFVKSAKFFSDHPRKNQQLGATVSTATSYSSDGLNLLLAANQSLTKSLSEIFGKQADLLGIVHGFPPEKDGPSHVVSVSVDEEKTYSVELSVHDDFKTIPEDYLRSNLRRLSEMSNRVDQAFRENLK